MSLVTMDRDVETLLKEFKKARKNRRVKPKPKPIKKAAKRPTKKKAK